MSTLAEMRAALRLTLGDTLVGSYLWPDAVLNQHLNDGIGAYGWEFPQELSTDINLVAGQRAYPLPAQCGRVLRVEVPVDDRVLAEGGGSYGVGDGWVPPDGAWVVPDPGSVAWPGYAPAPGYRVWGGNLILTWDPAGGELLRLSYLAPHAQLSADDTVSTVPAGDEGMVLAWAAARAVEGLAVEWAKRREFEEGTGRSAGDAAAVYRAEYVAGVRARKQRVRGSRLVVR